MTMLDSRAFEPKPCPLCDSTNVRWRRRRFYDVIRTYLRYIADRVVGAAFGGTRTTIIGPAYSDRASDARLASIEYREERNIYEDRVGTMTAPLFWKCPDCGRKGQVFDHLDGVLGERERLAGLEDRIEGGLGAVGNPIGSEEAKSD
ncbi:MAG: hypothetical protein KGK07_01925 [Chloroflexota bacterium]|nr:hypothetical protein [Chloroflexota bacterium]